MFKTCLYCYKSGHSIQNCNNEQFQIIKNNFYNIYLSSFTQSHHDFIKTKLIFCATIDYNYNFKHIQLISQCFNNVSDSETKENYLSYTSRYFTLKHMRDLNINSQVWLRTLTKVNNTFYIPINETFTYDERKHAFYNKISLALALVIEPVSDIIVEKININTDECPICYNKLLNNELVILDCSHQYCIKCINDTINLMDSPKCALCRKAIEI